MDASASRLRYVAWAAYLLAAFLIINPLFELAIGVWPLRPDEAKWRFGFLGLLANGIMTPMVAILFVFAAAAILDQRRVLTLLAALSASIAVILLVLAGFFILDVLQLHGQVAAQNRRLFDLASLKSLTSYLLGVAVMVLISYGSARSRRRERLPVPPIVYPSA